MRKLALVGLVVVAASNCTFGLDLGHNLPDEVDGGGLCVPGATASCYTGPEATEGVGLCTRGTATCEPDGTRFGACQGEVLPRIEDCATPVDEDCDGLAPPCVGAALWSKRFGVGEPGIFQPSLVVDPANNVIVARGLSGSADFGGGPLTSNGDLDIFIVKLDAAGNHLWSKRFGDLEYQVATALAVDADSNIIMAGIFYGSIDFGGSPLVNIGTGYTAFIVKLDAAGDHLWSKHCDSAAMWPPSLAVDGTGNIVMIGEFAGSMDCGGGALTSAGGADLFVAKLDAAGDHIWSRRFGDAAQQDGIQGAVDSAGNILLGGNFFGQLDLGGGALTSAGGADLFIAKLDPEGDHLWSRGFGDADDQWGYGMALDGSANVLITGELDGAVDFGDGPLVNAGNGDAFLAKFDAAGQHVWSKLFGDANTQAGFAVAAEASGNVVATGVFDGQIDFGGGPMLSAGNGDIFLTKLDPNGGHLWSKRFGDSTAQFGWSLATDYGGNTLAMGEFQGTIDFGANPLVSEGGFDIFVAKLSP